MMSDRVWNYQSIKIFLKPCKRSSSMAREDGFAERICIQEIHGVPSLSCLQFLCAFILTVNVHTKSSTSKLQISCQRYECLPIQDHLVLADGELIVSRRFCCLEYHCRLMVYGRELKACCDVWQFFGMLPGPILFDRTKIAV